LRERGVDLLNDPVRHPHPLLSFFRLSLRSPINVGLQVTKTA
jgi:hypothetical protein